MRSLLRWAIVSIGAIVCIFRADAVPAQTLTGATFYNADGNGSYFRKEYWVTGSRSPGWRLYFRKENDWFNDTTSAIHIPLTPGIHNLRFYADGGGEFPYAGVSLFFDNEDKAPALSVSARIAQSTLEQPKFIAALGNALRTDHTTAPAPGRLVYVQGGSIVELIGFRLLSPSVEKVDLVGPRESRPNLQNDYVGIITLRVTSRHVQGAGSGGSTEAVRNKIVTLTGHAGEVSSAVISPDGKYLVTCGGNEDKAARVWSMATGRELFTLFENPAILAAQFSPDSKCVLASIGNNTAQVWSLESGQVLFTLQGHSGPIDCMVYSPNGGQIVTGGSDGTVRIWDAKVGKQLLVLEGHNGPVLTIGFSKDGKRLVTAGRDKTVRIWEIPQELRREAR